MQSKLLLSLITSACALAQTPTLTVVSAATYSRDSVLAPEMIATAFSNAIPEVGSGSVSPLPFSHGGYTIAVRGTAGVEISAAIVAINAGQASFVVPAGLPDGSAAITFRRGTDALAIGSVRIARVAPGLFTANSSGEGAPAGL